MNFPLRQVSIDSVHEKNVRHGHISTLHIWPARRPLAACRAALIATLLPDPGNDEERKELLEKLGGKVVKVVKKKKLPSGKVEEKIVEETEGGILHWGRERGPDLDWFREKIREAYGGRAPKVLDPFAGGGAIPLEAMRLGCEATASRHQPGGLVHPQVHAGVPAEAGRADIGRCPSLPSNRRSSWRSSSRAQAKAHEEAAGTRPLAAISRRSSPRPEADLAWHVRAWGWWVLQRRGPTWRASTPSWTASPPWPTSGRAR